MNAFRYLLATAFVSGSIVMAQPPAAPAKPAAAAPAATSSSTAPGTISWHATKTGGEHTGSFTNWKFTKVDIPGGDLTKGTVEIEIDVTSLTTQPDKLQTHLKSPDFFNAVEAPKATVKIANAKPAADKDGKKTYDADATVTIKGVSQTMKANFAVLSEKPLKIKGTSTLTLTGYKFPYDVKSPGKINPPVEITIEATVPDKVEGTAAAAAPAKPLSAAAPAGATPVKGNATTATK